jgi:hypothetical protein
MSNLLKALTSKSLTLEPPYGSREGKMLDLRI